MASIDLTTNAGQATVAYQDALNQAKNAQNALLRQYGFTMPGAGGAYSVEAAQSAFDPNMLFNTGTGQIDQGMIQRLAGSLQAGTTGILSDITRGGGAAEAEALAAGRASGIAGGGLMAQRRALAESQTATQTGQAKSEFLAGVGQALSPIGSAFQQIAIGTAQDKAADEAAAAAAATTPTMPTFVDETVPAAESPVTNQIFGKPNTKGGILPSGSRGNYQTKTQPKGNVPKNPKPGQTFTGKQGVPVVYRPQGPQGAGWYKKGKK